MRCNTCEEEFSESLEACPHCGESLREVDGNRKAQDHWAWSEPGKLLETWPRSVSGELVTPAFLTHCSSQGMEDEMFISMLGAYGIPSVKQFPNDGTFGRIVLGMSGTGVDIYVPTTMLDEARELIKGDGDARI